MPSLLLVVLILQISIHVLNNIDGNVLGEILWVWYNKLPTPTSSSVKKVLESRKELVRLKRELGNVSAQDDFAKWAKIQRRHDKVSAEYEKTSSSVQSTRSTFISVIKASRFLGTNVLRFVLQYWYQKQPIFWLPKHALPYYIEWLLSCPKAPIGSVSIQAWWIACASVVLLGHEGLTAAIRLVQGTAVDSSKTTVKEEPMAFESSTVKTTQNGKQSKQKKEL